MAETNNNRVPSGTDRRATARESARASVEEEDEYDLAAEGVSDGFRPTNNAPTSHNRVSSHSSQRERRRSTPPLRPSSTTKPRNLDTFALRHDGNRDTVGAPYRPTTVASSSAAGVITRSSSLSTDNPSMRPESPYQGPTGPSHPYNMYPQTTRLARTASIATTSTNTGPTHPYGMYPQNTVPESESLHNFNPVGFPGHQADYQRRLGPDGEEAGDIIGPLGHTEQLPPYTKYPDEAFSRKLTPELPRIGGAGGIGLATRDPEFASRDDLNSPLSRQSQRSLTSDSDHQINVAGLAVSEKPPEKRWKIFARRKVWGIVPVWVFFMVAFIFLGFILILSIVLKSFMHHQSSTPKSSPAAAPSATMFTTITTTYDAQSLVTAPTGLSTLPTGTYSLSIATPSASQQSCLDNSNLYNAWSCDLPPDAIDVSISTLEGGSDTDCYKITMTSSYNLPLVFNYGTQPPIIASEQNLILVNDTQQSRWGPAWYFEVVYDKLVIVHEDDLSVPSNQKRTGFDIRNYENEFTRKGECEQGQTPWFCYWNNTVLETFIYVNQSSQGGTEQESASAAFTSITASTSNGQVSYSTSAVPSTPASTGVQPSAATTGAAAAATSSSADGNVVPGMLEGYPKVVKLEERRIPAAGAHLPYCVKMQIQPDGTATPYEDPNNSGPEDILYLNETEPSEVFPPAKRGVLRTDLAKRQTARLCQCVWFSE